MMFRLYKSDKKGVPSLIVVALLALVVLGYAGIGLRLYDLVATAIYTTDGKRENTYARGKSEDLRVLIVPGHSNLESGALYGDLREADLNLGLGYLLFDILNKDPDVNVMITRDEHGEYSSWLKYFMEREKEYINKFRDGSIRDFNKAREAGMVKERQVVPHNYATSRSGYELYAINYFANVNDFDVVLHIHFNDYPGRPNNKPGKYSGFAVYMPESQLPNSKASAKMAERVLEELKKVGKVSNLPGEDMGVVPDQDLIAIGASATRDNASILIEYGYIYEPQILDRTKRLDYLDKMATATYLGIKRSLE